MIDDLRSFQHDLPDGVRLLSIRFLRGLGVINIFDTLSDRYKPKGNAHTNEEGPGIDFIEVFQIHDWLDSAAASVQWILPDGHQWHPAAQSWVDLDWWDYERADEIAIRMVLHTVVAPVVQQYFGCGAALLGTLEDIFTTFYLVDPVPIELSFMVSFWDANG